MKKALTRYLSLAKKTQILLLVLAAHLLLFIFSAISSLFSPWKKPIAAPIAVRHFIQSPPSPKIQSAFPKKSSAKSSQKKKAAPKPKASLKKKAIAIKSKAPPKKKPPTGITSEAPPKKKELLVPIYHSPKAQTEKAPRSSDRKEQIVEYLKSVLELPEYGEVEIEMMIDAKGRVVKCSIIDAKSPKNAAYLMERLPLLCFAGYSEESESFSFTFCNAYGKNEKDLLR